MMIDSDGQFVRLLAVLSIYMYVYMYIHPSRFPLISIHYFYFAFNYVLYSFLLQFLNSQQKIAPYCSESDDFNDEAREVCKDQGAALPYSKGFDSIRFDSI